MIRGVRGRLVNACAIGILGFGMCADVRAQAPAQPARSAGKLEAGAAPIRRELAGAQTDVFQVDVPKATFAEVSVRKFGFDVAVTLIDPEGAVLLVADTPADFGGLVRAAWAAKAGRYSVRVAKADRAPDAAPYQITMALREPGEQDAARLAAQAKSYAAVARDRVGNREGRVEAIGLYQEAAELWKAIGATDDEAFALQRAGHLYAESGDVPKALAALDRALALRAASGDRASEVSTRQAMGQAQVRAGEYLKALESYEKKLAIQRDLGDRAGQAVTLTNIAYLQNTLGEPQKMLETFLDALLIRRALGDKRNEALALASVGNAFYSMGEQQKSLDTFLQVLAIRRSIGDRAGEAQTLGTLGNAYRDLGAEEKALEFYRQSIATARAAGQRASESDSEMGLGDVYFFLGEKQKSLDAYERSAALKRAESDKSGEALALIGVGNVYSDLASRQKPSESMGLPGKQKALEVYESALKIGRASGDFNVQVFGLMGAGVAYSALGDKKKAMDYISQALFFFATARFKPGEGWARYEMARVERDRGNLEKALTLAGNARDIIESLRSKVISPDLRATFFAAVHDCFGLEVDVLMRMHAADPGKNFQAEAITASERARARVLLETLGEANADIREGVNPALIERERDLQTQLNAKELARLQMMGSKTSPEVAKKMQMEVRDLAAQYEEVNTQIRASSPHYAALKFPQPLSLPQIQKDVLDPDTLLLEYSLGEQRSFLWVVSSDSISGLILPKRVDIEGLARRFHKSLLDPAATGSMEAGKSLSRMLLGEAGPLLGKKRLVVVADGALQYLPFAALPDPEGLAQPLVVNHEIVNLPSASTLAVLRRENANRKPAAKTLAVLADPVFSADDPRVARFQEKQKLADAGSALQRSLNDLGLEGVRLTRLPGTRREAAGIAGLVPENGRKQALDFDASRATLTNPDLGNYRILHLATHGLLNTAHPELSGVVLSLVDGKGKPQDGFMRLHQIYNLKLSADLVVLSACQTGLGKEIQGEGLVGLTRGFMYAGAPRVLASLWKVDDRATSELMKKLYGAMLGAEALRPAAALRSAQIAMWKTKGWENPYYWAAFTLQGEWR